MLKNTFFLPKKGIFSKFCFQKNLPPGDWYSPSIIEHFWTTPSSGHSKLSLSMYRNTVSNLCHRSLDHCFLHELCACSCQILFELDIHRLHEKPRNNESSLLQNISGSHSRCSLDKRKVKSKKTRPTPISRVQDITTELT